ncbi:MAG: ABC transporter permease [Steroidobacteraceae bacterium]
MKALRFSLGVLTRDLKSGELTVLALAVTIAVAALTGVGFFTNRIGQAVELQAAEVIAADLRLESPDPIAESVVVEAKRRGLETARVTMLVSVIFAGEQNQLTALRAVTEHYPLRGVVRIADRPFGPGRAVSDIPGPGEGWADSRLIARLGARIGDSVSVGSTRIRLTHVLEYRPDQGSRFVELAPTLLINDRDLSATGLIAPGSRVVYAVLFAGGRTAIADFKLHLEATKARGERLLDVDESSQQVGSSVKRAGQFLNLAGLISVLLSAIAVAMSARRYARRHLDAVALMKCMGASQNFILSISVIELLLIAIGTGIVGTAIGYGAQQILAYIVRELLSGALPPPSLAPLYLGLVTAITVLTGFALPPLLQLRTVPPLRVLRRNLDPPKLRYAASYGLAVAAVLAMIAWVVRDVDLTKWIGISMLITFAVLYGAGHLLVLTLSGLRGRVGVAWRYGLANIARRGRESSVQIVAFGLGLTVLLLLAVVRTTLLQEWRASLPAGAPNHFFINIRQDERETLQRFFTDRQVPAPELFPMIRARLIEVNGRKAADLPGLDDRGRGFAEREQNLTWTPQLQSDNEITAGRWWTQKDFGKPLVSIASEYERDLHLKLGDKLLFDVAGESLEVTVASIRKVRWDSFHPNFFLVMAPGLLENAAGTYMTSVHLTEKQKPMLVDLVREFPGVSVFDIDRLLSQVRDVMDKASRAVEYVFLFTLLAGVMVLLAAIQSTRDERRYESAMLRTLGASRRTVLESVAAEFTMLGLLAGTLASVCAGGVGILLAKQVFSIPSSLPLVFEVTAWGLVAGALLVGVTGTWAARSVVNHPPIATLRQE